MSIQQLVSDFNQLMALSDDIEAPKGSLQGFRHQQESSPDTVRLLAPLLGADGWLLTNQRRLRLPATLQEGEFALAGEAYDGQRHMQLCFNGQALSRHDWYADDSAEAQYLVLRHSHCGDGLARLHYLRLHNQQGQLVAALFNGFED